MKANINFGTERGPARVIAAINDVCDKDASDVISSFLHSDRIQGAVRGDAFLADRKVADALLSEIAMIIQVCYAFLWAQATHAVVQ